MGLTTWVLDQDVLAGLQLAVALGCPRQEAGWQRD